MNDRSQRAASADVATWAFDAIDERPSLRQVDRIQHKTSVKSASRRKKPSGIERVQISNRARYAI